MKLVRFLGVKNIALVLLFSINAVAATSEVEVPKFWDMVTNLPEDWQTFADENFRKENLGNLVALGAATAILVATDYETWKEFERHHNNNSTIHNLNWHFVSIGDGYAQFVMAGFFGAWGGLFKDKLALRTTSQIIEVIMSTAAVIQIMKHITGRESPFKATSRTGEWEVFPEQMRYHADIQKYDAVPSGHIATFYATFVVIQDNYPEQRWISWIGYPLTFLVAEGLVATGLHWWSDIPLGIAIGHSFAKIVTHRNLKGTNASSMEFGPVFIADGPPTIGVRYQW
jgi:hypothetical protein